MKYSIANIAFLFFAVLLGCVEGRAQNCPAWADVVGFKGNISLTASGSNLSSPTGFTVTLSSSAVRNGANLTGTTSCPINVGVFSQTINGDDGLTTANYQSSGTMACNPGTQTLVFSGTNSISGAQVFNINLDFSKNVYYVTEGVVVNGTATSTACNGGVTTSPSPIVLYPAELLSTPPSFALPASPTTLSQTVTFNGTDALWQAVAPWTLTFSFQPVLKTDVQDDPCKADAQSTIGCQNQSLGEDVPIAGTDFFLHYEGERAPGRSPSAAVANADAAMIGGWTLNVHHAFDPAANTLFLGDGGQRSAWQFGPLVTLSGNTLITPEDGSEVYAFNSAGQHVQTLQPLTGAGKFQFGYDGTGNLTTVTDASGNVTTIQRDSSGHATAIVSPYGQTTTLARDSNNFLSEVIDPAGNTEKFTNTASGLITAHTDSNGNSSTYTYDGNGRLAKDADSLGGYTALSRTDSTTGYSVTATTAMGRTTTFQVSTGAQGEQFTNILPNGLKATMANTPNSGQLSQTASLPDGTGMINTLGADPRWGLQAPVLISGTFKLGNLTMTTTGSRTATLGTAGNPFTLTTQTDTETINGRKYTSVFTGLTKTLLDTSPVKRTITTLFDSLERVSSVQVGALPPVTYTYDTHGRVAAVTQGTRVTTLTYDSNGFLTSATDPMKLTTSSTYDADGRVLTTTLPDTRVVTYSYDANGNMTAITPPGKSAHSFAFTAVDLTSSYTPPLVTGTGATTYSYNLDHDLTTVTRPDGHTITYSYDSAGRVSAITTPSETIDYSYDLTTGNLDGAAISGGESLAYSYNGPLLTSSALTGTVAGTVSRTYNNNFWIASQSLNGANTVNFTRDNDGLLTKAATLSVKRDPKDGLVTGTTLGVALDTFKYDTFGELTGYTAKFKVGTVITNLDQVAYVLDADGRVTTKTETIGGKKTIYAYTYDQSGRLTSVKQNGVVSATYAYDSNSNRLSQTTSAGTVNGTYDAQDRLVAYGNASYTYTANGELTGQTVGTQATSYSYDVLGNLTGVALPNGTSITYILDAANHRIGKVVNGTLQTGFLYDGDQIVAQLNGSNQIVSQFVYATGSTSPDFMINGGTTYRIFPDMIGSPRLVVNSTTGAIVERIDYDEFGNVINDTNPGFQPFGFAGGLYDQDTKLVRFGARDYNAAIGRWTAKDPIQFEGADVNLYDYVLSNPINGIDSDGTTIFRATPRDFKNAENAQKQKRDAPKEQPKVCKMPPLPKPPKPRKNPPVPGNPLNWIRLGGHGIF